MAPWPRPGRLARAGERSQSPVAGPQTSGDECRVARRTDGAMAERLPKGGTEVRQTVPDADALVVRQSDGAMLALAAVLGQRVDPGRKSDGPALPLRQERHGGGANLAAQIVIRAE